ncbi:hypothetical protein [Chitinophaga sp.]
MKEQATQKPVWTAPDLKVYEVNDITLGAGGVGFDFASESSV